MRFFIYYIKKANISEYRLWKNHVMDYELSSGLGIFIGERFCRITH
jgi:hypothetical protein